MSPKRKARKTPPKPASKDRAADPGRGEVVLGRMTARIDRLPAEGERCVVVGWPHGEDGRKLLAGTALYGEGGDVLAVARQVWIAPRQTD